MKTRIFTIIKTGYTAGIYGNSGEYFTCTYTKISKYNGNLEMAYFHFKGQYGVEERVAEALKDKRFVSYHTNGNYGKLKQADIYPNTMGEYEAIDFVKSNFKHNED